MRQHIPFRSVIFAANIHVLSLRAGLPAITVPVGHDADNSGMPIGLQLIGNHWEEHTLLHLAHHTEDAVQNSRVWDSSLGPQGVPPHTPSSFVDLLAESTVHEGEPP